MSEAMWDRAREAIRAREGLRVAARRDLPCGHVGELVPVDLVGHGGRRWECVVCDCWWRESLTGGLVRSVEVPS